MAKYKLMWNGRIVDTETDMPLEPISGSEPYEEYLAWVDAGNSPDEEFDPADAAKVYAFRDLHSLQYSYLNVDRALLKLIIRLATLLISKGVMTKAEIGDAYVDGVQQLKAYLDDIETKEGIING